jgi:hypothetical protein
LGIVVTAIWNRVKHAFIVLAYIFRALETIEAFIIALATQEDDAVQANVTFTEIFRAGVTIVTIRGFFAATFYF